MSIDKWRSLRISSGRSGERRRITPDRSQIEEVSARAQELGAEGQAMLETSGVSYIGWALRRVVNEENPTTTEDDPTRVVPAGEITRMRRVIEFVNPDDEAAIRAVRGELRNLLKKYTK